MVKKQYIKPAVMAVKIKQTTLLAGSIVENGGSNQGSEKPHTAESKMWSQFEDDEE